MKAQNVLTRPWWQRYLGAAALTCFVVAGRLALNPWWGIDQNRHLVLLPTVMLAAWAVGFGPGVVSALLCTLALYIFWSKSPALIHLPGADVLLFLPFSLAICSILNSLQLARTRANAATRSREKILEIVAHDLRGPLTAISVIAGGMARTNPSLTSGLKRIQSAVGRMDKLVGDLIDSTRIDQGELRVSMRLEPVDPMVQETVGLFSPMAESREIRLQSKEGTPGLSVECDRDRIIQVLSNLVGNALKFTPPGGAVTLTVREEAVSPGERGGAVLFAVEDTGVGINPSNLQHVFEQYWKSGEGGTGLGLFIARSIVTAHGGTIWAEPAKGRGTTFFVRLPRQLPS